MAKTAEEILASAEELLAPISDDAPGGQNAKYDADYEELKAEVQKLDSPRAEQVEWKRVRQISEDLLKNRSKDFVIACHYAYALYENQGFEGLSLG